MMRVQDAPTQRKAGILQRGEKGFTLFETLVALLIFVVLTGVVAMGIPVAFNTYKKVLDSSNAQLALSTTTAALRDELGLAVDAKMIGGKCYYKTSDGYWATIDNPADGGKGLVKVMYNDSPSGFDPHTATPIPTSTPMTLVPESTFASSLGSGDLRIEMDAGSSGGISYADGVFSVSGLAVTQDGNELESIDEPYEIKAVFGPFQD